jgi:hypothetical protein
MWVMSTSASGFFATSWEGEIAHGQFEPIVDSVEQRIPRWGWDFLSRDEMRDGRSILFFSYPGSYKFTGLGIGPCTEFGVPHWFLVVVTGALAVLLKPKPRLKFSLRELLTLTTVAAIVLGGVIALARIGN